MSKHFAFHFLTVFSHRGHEVDFNLKRIYDMPNIEVSKLLAIAASLISSTIANDLLLREL